MIVRLSKFIVEERTAFTYKEINRTLESDLLTMKHLSLHISALPSLCYQEFMKENCHKKNLYIDNHCVIYK